MRWLAIVALMASSGAQASDYEALWKNSDPAQAAKWVKLCDTSSCSRAVAVVCAPGATCRTRFPDPPSSRNLWVAVSADGAVWSLPSNTVVSDACLLSTACRVDIDRSGTVTTADFAELLKVLGTAWR
jgi:hypothetical protein